MTLGKKLSAYRKIAGLTQQQLGEKLNLSAQAISKWENDLAEPDLSSLRILADLYQVSVDTLLDLNDAPADPTPEEDIPAHEDEKVDSTAIIGFCKTCGITVTEANLGATEPVIICKKCLDAKIEADKIAEENRKKSAIKAEEDRIKRENERKASEAAKKSYINARTKQKLVRTFILAGIFAVIFLALCIVGAGAAGIVVGLIGGYIVFAYISCMCLDTIVNEVFFDWISKSFEAPGLIFTFDVDGCLWLIGMKILFWALGILFSIFTALVGILIGVVLAIFDFPYVMIKIHRDYKAGEESEYIEY